MATVVSSRCENFPYVLLEAMAAGSPLVSTDWPGAEEIVIDGESGLLSPIAQPDRLAVTLDRILRDGQRAAGMGHAARERCASEFSLEIVGDKLLDCYRQTLEMPA
jgi:glycosyltransferase involved in cell wall biosynthesis